MLIGHRNAGRANFRQGPIDRTSAQFFLAYMRADILADMLADVLASA